MQLLEIDPKTDSQLVCRRGTMAEASTLSHFSVLVEHNCTFSSYTIAPDADHVFELCKDGTHLSLDASIEDGVPDITLATNIDAGFRAHQQWQFHDFDAFQAWVSNHARFRPEAATQGQPADQQHHPDQH